MCLKLNWSQIPNIVLLLELQDSSNIKLSLQTKEP